MATAIDQRTGIQTNVCILYATCHLAFIQALVHYIRDGELHWLILLVLRHALCSAANGEGIGGVSELSVDAIPDNNSTSSNASVDIFHIFIQIFIKSFI